MSFDPDARFERALVESARGDAEPQDVSAAWARFAEALVSTAPGANRRSGEAAGDSSPRMVPASGVHAGRVRPVKWLLLGALAGAAPMVAVVVGHRPTATVAPATVGAAPVSAGLRTAPAVASVPHSSSTTPMPEAQRAKGGATRAGTPPRRRSAANATIRSCRAGDEAGSATEAPSSTLAAEVSRIDTARTARLLGDYDEATRLVDQYHRDFPHGVLGPDADVVALEAAAARGDQTEVARRAAVFLARYPNDPQGARVRDLVARFGGR
jgi:hypothetical protein